MTYRVVLQRLAKDDLRVAHLWAARRAPVSAARWLERFQESLQTLERSPQRCPLARESRRAGIEVREHHFGKRPYVFRSLFTLDEDAVRILRIRRAQRRPLTRAELRQALDAGE
jgi:plasmid stabilization system protein ParE